MHQDGLPPLGRLVALAYPIMDLTLVSVLFRSVVFWSKRQPFHWLLVAAMSVMFLADFIAPLLLVITSMSGAHVNAAAVSILCLAVFALISVRMLWMLRRIGDQAVDLEHHALELEASDQLDRLIELGCPKSQGLLLSRPLDVDQATGFPSRIGVAIGSPTRCVGHHRGQTGNT